VSRAAPSPAPPITELLVAWGQGDQHALDRLAPLVYKELQRLAQWQMRRERAGHTLQATALVNEAYLRLVDINRVEWQNRTHFFAIAGRQMRRVLVDAARARGNQKRGGDVHPAIRPSSEIEAGPIPVLVQTGVNGCRKVELGKVLP
jgi:RNA polymerase sigma factor (TIGR02999 family)